MKLIYGIGLNDLSGISKCKKLKKSYSCWVDMLKRCYSEIYLKKHPTYKNCRVCKDWHLFSNFNDWFNKNYITGFCLDKDYLSFTGKFYSPCYCVFIPQEINKLLNSRINSRGEFPVGVTFSKKDNLFYSQIQINGKTKSLGSYRCPKLAHKAYLIEKKSYVNEKLCKFVEDGKITEYLKRKISTKLENSLINIRG